MSSLATKIDKVTVAKVTASNATLTVELSDGRSIVVPLAWYPRLVAGTKKERNSWRLIAGGSGIHWPELDEDISLDNLLFGQPSGESQRSFDRWQATRAAKNARKRKSGA